MNAHYVYKITNINPVDERRFYIGVRTAECGNPENDTCYMGSSNYLDEAIREQGLEFFSKEILSTWETRELANLEEIRLHEEFDVDKNIEFYNKAKSKSTGFSCSITKEIKEKISKANTGRRWTPEQRKKITKALKNPSIQTREKISKATKGRKLTNEWKQKIGESNKKKMTDGHKKMISLRNKGKVPSIETKEKISKALKGFKHTTQTKDKRSKAFKGRKLTDEWKLKIKEANKFKGSYKIHIFNNNDVLVHDVFGNFNEFCNSNNLPVSALKKSYTQGGSRLYQTKQAETVATKNNFIQFKGW